MQFHTENESLLTVFPTFITKCCFWRQASFLPQFNALGRRILVTLLDPNPLTGIDTYAIHFNVVDRTVESLVTARQWRRTHR